jgi:HlyD family secretion protein
VEWTAFVQEPNSIGDPDSAAKSASAELQPPPVANLPATIPAPHHPGPRRRRARPLLLLLALIIGGAGGGYWWWQRAQVELLLGIVMSNGRIEADEIDIATKFAGRVADILADEGDVVKLGQVLARMDVRDLEASLGKAEAQIQQAQKAIDAGRADLDQQKSQVVLAGQELERARLLFERGNGTKETLDQRQAQMNGATAAYMAIEARMRLAEHALVAAQQDAALIRVNIADNALVAPRDGRIQYRLANVGEVLSAGGKVFTMLDTAYVYMDIFLPTAEAGRVVLGSDARILLDALPERPLPARVAFIADQAQFTPKAVETKSERDKLMFRVRLRIDPVLLRAHADKVRSGLPGLGYVLAAPQAAWPTFLQARLPQSPEPQSTEPQPTSTSPQSKDGG